jgi:FkbM family methyltransferase
MDSLSSILRSLIKLLLGKGVHTSYGQDGEDVLVDSLLRKKNGVYVDVGAYHPILYSNTYGFYRKGWKGLVIDPNATLAPLYAFFRSRDTFARAAVGTTDGEGAYHRFKDGAYNTLSSQEAEKWKSEKRSPYLGTEQVRVRPLRDLTREAGITEVDFLNIDIEGMDVEALESYDWNIPPKVIAIEDNAFNAHMPETSPAFRYLTEKGYRLASFSPRTLIFAKA